MRKKGEQNVIWYVIGALILFLAYIEFFLPTLSTPLEITKLFSILLLSVFIISESASYSLDAITRYAKNTGISEYVIGFLVVAVGTSLPELSTAIFSSLAQQGQLTAGNIIGANVLDLTIVLGITILVARKLHITKNTVGSSFVPFALALFVPFFLARDGLISRVDGFILLAVYSCYLIFLFSRKGSLGHMKRDVAWVVIWKDMVIFIGSILALLLAARWLVFSATHLAGLLNVPVFLVGLIIVSIGTTLPELVVNVKSVLYHSRSLALGDILGSVITNGLFVIGIAAIIRPIVINSFSFLTSYAAMYGVLLFTLFLLKKKVLKRKHGILLILLYFAFLALESSHLS